MQPIARVWRIHWDELFPVRGKWARRFCLLPALLIVWSLVGLSIGGRYWCLATRLRKPDSYFGNCTVRLEEVDAPPGVRHEKLDRVWLGPGDRWRREYATFTRIRIFRWDYCVFLYVCPAISAPPELAGKNAAAHP